MVASMMRHELRVSEQLRRESADFDLSAPTKVSDSELTKEVAQRAQVRSRAVLADEEVPIVERGAVSGLVPQTPKDTEVDVPLEEETGEQVQVPGIVQPSATSDGRGQIFEEIEPPDAPTEQRETPHEVEVPTTFEPSAVPQVEPAPEVEQRDTPGEVEGPKDVAEPTATARSKQHIDKSSDMNDIVTQFRTGVFTGVGDPSLVIPCALPSIERQDGVAWDACVRPPQPMNGDEDVPEEQVLRRLINLLFLPQCYKEKKWSIAEARPAHSGSYRLTKQ